MEYRKNDNLTLEILSLGSNGEGIAKADGFPIFVKDCIPGDLCEVKLVKVKKNLAFGRVMKIIKPSKDRIEAKCPVSKRCGGCTLQVLSYEKQLEYKKNRIYDCLHRIGGISEQLLDEIMEDTVGMEEPYRYRNKAQYPVGTDREGNLAAGFYASRSHDIVPNDDCLLLPEEFKDILKVLTDFMEEKKIPPYDEISGRGVVRHFVLRKAFGSGEIMAVIVSASDELSYEDELIGVLKKTGKITTAVLNVNKEDTNVILGPKNRILYGDGYITDQLCGLKFRISALSFYQVNPFMAEKIYETAAEFAGLSGSERVWDVCCGIGTIALYLAGFCSHVLGIEIVPEAIADAVENARINGIDNADFMTGAAEKLLPKLLDDGIKTPDVIVLDPPRSGMEKEAIEAVTGADPKKIVYVSCDPATLARDIKLLAAAGYSLQRVRPFDQFCQSSHVEVVSLLQRVSNIRERTITLDVEMEDYHRIKNRTEVTADATE